MGNIKSEVAKMAEQDDATRCGICGEPFKEGEVAVQAARCQVGAGLFRPNKQRIVAEVRAEKFWAHPVCVFSVAREDETAPSEKLKSK
jgi:hypothetical protein